MPVANIANAATIFKRLLTNNLVGEKVVFAPIIPQIRDVPAINKGVIFPYKGKNASSAIKPAINGLMPKATVRKSSSLGLSIRNRFFPLLIFSVSIIILKAIIKQNIRTTIFEYFSNRCINLPPSNEPSQYISPCPTAKTQTNSILRHQPFFFSILKAVAAMQTQKVIDMMKR